MSRLQPVGQKKLTNICVVRYKRAGKRFEVAAYRNTVLAWRNGNQTDLDEVLQAHTIFSNLEKGDIAKSEDLVEAFGTDNEDVVCVEVLNKGEFQVSEEERQAHLEQLFKDVAARVTDMVVNPETQKPYPLSTIERYLRETLHFAPTDKKSAKQQALVVVRQLEQAADFPVMRAQMRLRLRVPDRATVPRVQLALHELAASASRAAGGKAAGADGSGGGGGGGGAPERLQVMAPEDLHDETVAIDCLADPGLYRDIGEIATKHSSSLQVLELKAAATDAETAAAASAMAAAPSAAAVVSGSAAMPTPTPDAPTASPAAAPTSVGGASAQQQQRGGGGGGGAARRGGQEMGAEVADDIFARVDGRQQGRGGRGGGGKNGGAAAGGKGGKGGGKGGGGDPEEAARRKAERMFKLNLRNAETGDPVAQLEVGKALLDGVGCAADVNQGRHWLEQASLQGVNAATARLETMSVSID